MVLPVAGNSATAAWSTLRLLGEAFSVALKMAPQHTPWQVTHSQAPLAQLLLASGSQAALFSNISMNSPTLRPSSPFSNSLVDMIIFAV